MTDLGSTTLLSMHSPEGRQSCAILYRNTRERSDDYNIAHITLYDTTCTTVVDLLMRSNVLVIRWSTVPEGPRDALC